MPPVALSAFFGELRFSYSFEVRATGVGMGCSNLGSSIGEEGSRGSECEVRLSCLHRPCVKGL